MCPCQVDRLKNKRIYKLNKILLSPPAVQQGEIFRHEAVAKCDNNGNILARYEYAITAKPTSELHLLDCTCFNYAYDDNSDQLMSYNGETFVYDQIGNPTTYRGKSAVWEYGRQLKSYDGNTFAYDARGRRTAKNGIAFTYDSNGNLIQQSNGLEFLYDHTGVFAVKHNGSTFFYQKDALGNIVKLLDNTGAVVVEYKYDAWGKCEIDASTTNTELANLNPFRYRGYYFDTETGFYFLKTRYYDPEIGRFMTIDDLSYLDPDSINGLNLYAYCNDNPVMGYDPNGCFDWKTLFGYAMAFGLAAIAVVGIVASGGALLIPVLVGAGVGLAANVIGQGVGNLISEKGFFDGFSIESALMGMLAGAAFAAAGGFWATVAVGAMANAGTSALQQKSWKQIGLSAIGGAISAGVGYALGKLVGCEVYGDDDMTITDYRNMARLDEGEIRAWGTAFASSWKSLLPNIANSGTRGILKFLSNKGIDLF